MRIIGIDPGLRKTGFGVIEKQQNKINYLASGTITTDAKAPLSHRLGDIFQGVGEVVKSYQPSCAVIEIVFVNMNPQSTLLLGQARGAALCALNQSISEIHEYTALQLKQAVVGYGRASKIQMQHMVQNILALSALPSSDAADALGLAITHANSSRYSNTLLKRPTAPKRRRINL